MRDEHGRDQMTLRVGVIGTGYWGVNYLRILNERTDTSCIAIDPDESALQHAVRRFPDLRTATELESVSSDLDAVIVCTPVHAHGEAVDHAIDHRLHVLVEKPFAASSSHCLRLSDRAARADLTLMVGHTYDYHPVVHDLAYRVRHGELGNVRYLDSARLSLGGYREDVNVLWDMAPHDIVIMRRILGSWPTRVSAWCIDHTGHGVPDVGMIRLEFQSPSTVGYIRVSWLDPMKVRRFTVVGSEKTAVFNDVTDPTNPLRIVDTGLEPRLGEGTTHPLPPAYNDDLISKPEVQLVEPLAGQVDHFLQCIKNDATPRSSAHEGLQVVRVLEAADESATTGLPVELNTPPAVAETA